MKKIGFALQVVGLLALIPLCVALELTHGQMVLPEKPGMKTSASFEKQNETTTPGNPKESSYLIFPVGITPTYANRN